MQIHESHQQVFHLITAAWGSQTVRTLAELSVAEHLASGPLDAREIAARESTELSATHRLLRAGVALGLLTYDRERDLFSGTASLDVLREDSPYSLKYYALFCGGLTFWKPAMLLPDAVRTGKNQAAAALGTDLFDHLRKNPDVARQFSAAMTDASAPVIRAAADVMSVESARVIVDVGGSSGTFVTELVRRNPQVSGIVLDLPHVVPGVVEYAERHGVGGRVTGVAGDFFQSVPTGDAYLLKFILHDWDDESCVTVLRNIRRAMVPGARLYIVDMVVDDSQPDVDAAMMDMAMLFSTGGLERSVPEFEALLDAADLRMTRIEEVWSPYHLIEAEPS